MAEVHDIVELVHEPLEFHGDVVGGDDFVFEHAVQKGSHGVGQALVVVLPCLPRFYHFVHVVAAENLHVQLRHPDLLDDARSHVQQGGGRGQGQELLQILLEDRVL